MVTYKLKEETTDKVIYEYFVEGRGVPGILVYIKTTKELLLEVLSDDEHGFRTYANHARRSILRDIEEDRKFPENGMAAWY